MTDAIAVSTVTGKLICGKQNAGGGICKRKPGLGTPFDHGPCYQHTAASLNTLVEKKKEFLVLLHDPHLTVSNIAKLIDTPVSTVYQWSLDDSVLATEWRRIMSIKEGQRTEIIEESMFKRASDEKIQNPAESIFWLKNRAPHRWKDKVVQEVTGVDGKALMPIDALRSFLVEEETVVIAKRKTKKLISAKASDNEIVIPETK